MTRLLVRILIGQALQDTQTGLRGIPRELLWMLLRVSSNGYEFELDTLITAKHHGIFLRQLPIETIYVEENASSHFNPVLDSMRIYFVLLRFSFVSVLTALIDNIIFLILFWSSGNIAMSQAGGRASAVLFNYSAARRAVFFSREAHFKVLPRYLLLVAASGLLSYALLVLIATYTPLPVEAAKIIAESLLFVVNFAIQRDFVFVKRGREIDAATNWDRYYKAVPPTARITRRYTTRVLMKAICEVAEVGPEQRATIVEFGGANSCFLSRIKREIKPAAYHVIDTNKYGLDLLKEQDQYDSTIYVHEQSVLDQFSSVGADLAFSVGLIEHFDSEGTRQAIRSHFDVVRPGGVVILSFPYPTALYRLTRGALEALGLWKFPDERPLGREEVLSVIEGRGGVLYEYVLWPILLTQLLIVARKESAAGSVNQRTDVFRLEPHSGCLQSDAGYI